MLFKIKPLAAFIIVLTCIFFTAMGCQTNKDLSESGNISLLVTKDKGREVVFSERVPFESGQSVLSVMNEHLEVEYAYGGKFINSIEGVKSGYTGLKSGAEKDDWFFYANGTLCGTGAKDYYLRDGDVIWWDYSSWEKTLFVPAVTGAFPQPFLNGYKDHNPGTIIMYDNYFKDSAHKIRDYLHDNGASSINIIPYEPEDFYRRNMITLVIALWEDLEDDTFWQGLQENRDKTGWFVEFKDDKIIPLNIMGEIAENKEYADAVLIATGSGMGDAKPLWLITAFEESKIEDLIEIIIRSPESIYGSFSVALINDQIVSLPLK